MSKNIFAAILIPLLISSCTPEPKRPPTPEPDQACAAACQRREELDAECHWRKKSTVADCTEKCNLAERLRPGITHASCVAVSLNCKEVEDCSDRP